MNQLVAVGTFGPYPECGDYGQTTKGNLIH
jgi:transposase-like protein